MFCSCGDPQIPKPTHPPAVHDFYFAVVFAGMPPTSDLIENVQFIGRNLPTWRITFFHVFKFLHIASSLRHRSNGHFWYIILQLAAAVTRRSKCKSDKFKQSRTNSELRVTCRLFGQTSDETSTKWRSRICQQPAAAAAESRFHLERCNRLKLKKHRADENWNNKQHNGISWNKKQHAILACVEESSALVVSIMYF